MRNISFSATVDQIRNKTKTVTRRLGWVNIAPGERLQGVEKAMGLKPGEEIKRLAVIEVVGVRREKLKDMLGCAYGFEETTKEGFPDGHPKHWPSHFVEMFCGIYGCTPETEVTRIEFKYVE